MATMRAICFACPRCNSDETKAIKILIETESKVTKGLGLTYSRRGGVGVLGGGVREQSKILSRYSLERPPRVPLICRNMAEPQAVKVKHLRVVGLVVTAIAFSFFCKAMYDVLKGTTEHLEGAKAGLVMSLPVILFGVATYFLPDRLLAKVKKSLDDSAVAHYEKRKATFQEYEAKLRHREDKRLLIKRGWVCLRCGREWVPGA